MGRLHVDLYPRPGPEDSLRPNADFVVVVVKVVVDDDDNVGGRTKYHGIARGGGGGRKSRAGMDRMAQGRHSRSDRALVQMKEKRHLRLKACLSSRGGAKMERMVTEVRVYWVDGMKYLQANTSEVGGEGREEWRNAVIGIFCSCRVCRLIGGHHRCNNLGLQRAGNWGSAIAHAIHVRTQCRLPRRRRTLSPVSRRCCPMLSFCLNLA